MRSIGHELRIAFRSLRRSALTSGFIVATLAICIGAVAAVYSVVDTVLVRGLPFRQPQDLVWISSVGKGRPDRPFSLPEFLDYRLRTASVQLAAYTSWNGIVDRPTGAERVQGVRMSGNALGILGVTPTIGRMLNASDDSATAPKVLVIGYGYWRRSFAGDRAVLGRALTLNGERYTVVGVLPRFFPIPVRDVDAVVPLDPQNDARRNVRKSVNFLRFVGRRTTTIQAVDRELNTISARLREQFPTEYGDKLGVRVMPLQQYISTTQRPTLVVLMLSAALMIVVALANVLSLLLARAVAREGETAVRLALGASAPRIARQLLAEGAILVGAAGALGILMGSIAITSAAAHLTTIAPRIDEATLSLPVLGLVFGVCAISTLFFCLVPLLIARAASPQAALRSSGRSGGTSPAQARLRSAFVIGEIALAVVITSATGALVQNLITLQRVELGYRPDSVFVARLALPPKTYQTPAEIARFSTALKLALGRTPEVVAVGGVAIAPFSGVLRAAPFAPAQNAPPTRDWESANLRAASPGYLEAIAARPVAGRLFAEQDDGSAPAVAVVNRTLAETFFAKGRAVGSSILLDDNSSGPRALLIVGVVDDLREVDLDGPIRPEVFTSLSQVPQDGVSLVAASQFWMVRVHGSAPAFATTFARVVREVDPGVAIAQPADLRDYVDGVIAPRRFSVAVLVAFSSIALLLTTLGVYGIAAYAAEQRRREIGVRTALGATPAAILGLMLGRSLRLAGIGVAAGLAGAVLSGTFVSRLMFGVAAVDPGLLAASAVLLLGTSALASSLPARRATRVDLITTLRAD